MEKRKFISEKYIYPIVLLLFGFVTLNMGIDITDSGYNLGNFTYLSDLDRMWYYSTLLANFLGWVIARLPFGGCMLGMAVYLRLVRAAFVYYVYRFLAKETKVSAHNAFLGLLLSLALCWAPIYGVYHYLTYYLFTAAAIELYKGLKKDKRINLAVAGILLALNVFVRFPNICEVALIVAVWWYFVAAKRSFKEAFSATMTCVAGYFGTLVVFFGIIAIRGNLGLYINSIKELFAMTGESERYGMWFTIRNLINSYTCVWYWLIPVAIGFTGLIILGFFPEKFKKVYYGIAVAGIAVVYAWFYKTKLFDYNFRSYSSMYLFGVVMLIVFMGLFLYGCFSKSYEPEEKLLFVASIVFMFVTPLGSNNSLFVVLNDLFLIAPMAIYIASSFYGQKRLSPLSVGIMTLTGIFIVQMVFFGTMFTFREKQPVQDTYVSGLETVKGMRTTESNGAFLEDIAQIWEKEGLIEAPDQTRVLTFGDVPGIAYYTKTRPAMSSSWPSLPSYSVEKFTAGMKELEGLVEENGITVVCVTDFNLDAEGEKQDILKEFLEKYSYEEVYSDYGYTVWLIRSE